MNDVNMPKQAGSIPCITLARHLRQTPALLSSRLMWIIPAGPRQDPDVRPRMWAGERVSNAAARTGGGPARDLVGERIPHRGQPQYPLTGHDPGQVGRPLPVRLIGVELRVDRIRCGDPLHALAAQAHTLAAQLQPHPQGSMRRGGLVRCADVDDHLQQLCLLQMTAAGRGLACTAPAVGGVHTEYPVSDLNMVADDPGPAATDRLMAQSGTEPIGAADDTIA